MKKVKSMSEPLLNAIILLFILFALCASCEGKSPFNDINIPQGETSTYEVKEGETTRLSSFVVSREVCDEQAVYVIRTDSMEMILTSDDMRPISVKKRNKNGELEFSIEYKPKRVHFIYPGPKRNKVMKISDNSYDVNTMLEVMRCYPFDRDKIKFKLVTPDRVVSAYAKIIGEKKVSSTCGDFDCYLIEGGVSGLLGKVVRTKFLFWVEKKYPHRLVKYKDDERFITLIDYKIPRPLEVN